jgi:hypothetical protein
MQEREGPEFFDERFTTLSAVQEGLARYGYLFYPIGKEHTEALITGPLLHRIRTQISKRGFGNLAGRLIVTFSGFARDEREVFAIPEARAYWQRLDQELPELPALLALLPGFDFNGPGLHLMLLGAIDTVVHRPALGGYNVQVADAPRIVDDATRRIRAAGQKYHLRQAAVSALIDHFLQGTGYRRS